jgi:hypothetical protein
MLTASVSVAAQAALCLWRREMRWSGLIRLGSAPGVIRVLPAPCLNGPLSWPGSIYFVSWPGSIPFVSRPSQIPFVSRARPIPFVSWPGSIPFVSRPSPIRLGSRPRSTDFVVWRPRFIRRASRPRSTCYVSWPGLARPPTTLHQTERQIGPFRICCDDQTDFPGSGPPLDAGFTLYGCPYICVRLAVNQAIELIAASKRRPKAVLMCSHTAGQIARHAEVQRSVWAIGHDVDPAGGHGRDITHGWLRKSLSRPLNWRERRVQVVGGRAKPGHDTRQTEPAHDARRTKLGHETGRTKPGHDTRHTGPGHNARRIEPSHDARRPESGHGIRRMGSPAPSAVNTPCYRSEVGHADAA